MLSTSAGGTLSFCAGCDGFDVVRALDNSSPRSSAHQVVIIAYPTYQFSFLQVYMCLVDVSAIGHPIIQTP